MQLCLRSYSLEREVARPIKRKPRCGDMLRNIATIWGGTKVRTKQAVTGQTGSVVLSDLMLHRKKSHKRTVRYQYTKVKDGWTCWVSGPIHSPLYGTMSFGPKKERAKASLERNLANNYRYFGAMLLEADKRE